MNSNERKDNKDENSTFYDSATNVIGGVRIIVALAGLLLLSLGSDSDSEEKMKAAGQDGYIPLKYFKDHPPKRVLQESA
ncbi:unnamed protein product [Arabis nemorensis]|uniref:Uncharacterized protein n=1 Tax=Arabis nemorensis TaxID=586526 RepID=A0A565C6M5_9BRAS|nr:unnamed protein product [Arabis nemorensis]